MADNWFDSAIKSPYLRQKPLCVYGPNAHNRSLVISFLKGYFHPMTNIDVSYRDVMDGHNAWLLDRQLIVVSDYKLKHMDLPPGLLHASKLDIKSKVWHHERHIDNVTKWIIDSEIILPDCVTLDIKHVEPFLINNDEAAMDLGAWHRRRDKRLTKTFLRTVLNNRKAKP